MASKGVQNGVQDIDSFNEPGIEAITVCICVFICGRLIGLARRADGSFGELPRPGIDLPDSTQEMFKPAAHQLVQSACCGQLMALRCG
jgi:hypothetical protein